MATEREKELLRIFGLVVEAGKATSEILDKVEIPEHLHDEYNIAVLKTKKVLTELQLFYLTI